MFSLVYEMGVVTLLRKNFFGGGESIKRLVLGVIRKKKNVIFGKVPGNDVFQINNAPF